jgi:soluble lytic murein transglycosylase-like protein
MNTTIAIAAFLMQLCGPQAKVYAKPVLAAAALYDVSPFLLVSIMRQESHCQKNATGKLGEIGLMQIKPGTLSTVGYTHLSAKQLRAPATNIKLGARFLRYCLNFCDGFVAGALGLYSGWPKSKLFNLCRVSNYSFDVLSRVPES